MSEKTKKIADSAENEVIAEEIKKESEKKADSAIFDKIDKKVDSIGADLKEVIDKIDSFEVDTDEVLQNVSHETKDEKTKGKGAIALILVVAVLILFAFKDKIANAIQQKRQNP